MSRQPDETWPPLIVASDKPRWVWWRDFALTLAMWLAFAIMLETEFELFFGRYLEHLGLGDFDTNANWARFFERLRPYIYLIISIVAFLAAAALATIARYYRALQLPPPAPLAVVREAHRARMDETDLLAARELGNVVVHIAPDGTHRVERRRAAAP
jgi:hypothetical protein